MAKTLLSNETIIKLLGIPEAVYNAIKEGPSSDYEPAANAFLSALVNKITYQEVDSYDFDNPFAKYTSYDIEYGDTIEEVFTEMSDDTKQYKLSDTANTDPFTIHKPKVQTRYRGINYEMQYPITVFKKELRKAVLTPNGLSSLIIKIMEQPRNKMRMDSYTATIGMLANADNFASGVEILDVSTAADDKEKYKQVTAKIIGVTNDFKLPSISNNKAGVMAVTPLDKVLLIIKQEVLDKINIDYLAGVYNLSKTELVSKIIPVRSFDIVTNNGTVGSETPTATTVGIDFMIIDERGFANHKALQEEGSIYNPKGMYTNSFLNVWAIYGFKPWFQARAYKLKLTD